MKKLNSILFLLITIIFISCNSENSKKTESTNQSTKKNEDFLNKDTIIPFAGFWINEKYYKELLKSKSPRKAFEKVRLIAINIPDRTLQWTLLLPNFRIDEEGLIFVKTNYKFQLNDYYNDRTVKKYNVDIIDTGKKLKIENDYFINAIGNTNSNIYKFLEEILFTGKYKLNDKIVELTKDGKVIGLEGINLYEPLFNYFGSGKNIDIIYLDKSRDDLAIKDDLNTYTFKFKGDSLLIFDYKCIDFDSLNNICNEATYGNIKYKMKKL